MSLEKFQATDAWRNKFKNLLFTERKPSNIAPTKPVTRTPQRLSFELSEDLQVILEEKKIPRGGSRMPRVRNSEDNKENLDQQFELLHTNTPTKMKSIREADATLVEEPNDVLQITNTSFETLEEMCEKTASDPDSTLFHYLNRSSMMQTRSSRIGQTFDEEADALQRLLDELNVEEQQKRLKAQSALNVTQLEDIEAPTSLWENTLIADTMQSISPVKLVGLLRQSTIMEEGSDADASEGDTSTNSYQSATKAGWSTETTGCYETANETATSNEQQKPEKKSIDSLGASSSSSSLDLFQPRPSRQKFFSDEKEDLEESVRLIDLEETVVEPGVYPLEPESSVDNSNSTKNSSDDPEDSLEPPKSSPETTQCTESDISSSVIEVSEDDYSMGTKILEKIEKLEAESVLNRSFTIQSEEPDDDGEKSLHFNDTMEEVEYMMKKGLQYMEAAKVEPVSTTPKSHLTPVKNQERYRSPSPMLSSPATPKTVIAKPKPVNKHALDIKPFPKLELFKKPQPTGLKQPSVQNKFVSALKKQNYAHIVSPIGAYIKKTPTTPFISTIKSGCSDDGATSKAFKQLEFDSRVKPQEQVPKAVSSNVPTCSLPMKAYISSEYKQIVDDRTKFTIPGGPKVQRYIQPSLIPAVVRHEGKIKIPANLRTSDMAPPLSRRTDDSLADLSLMSGDVSVYTIKDAQKF